MTVGVRNVRPGCWIDMKITGGTIKDSLPCRAWPEQVEPPSVFGHVDCYQCARFTRIPDAPTKE